MAGLFHERCNPNIIKLWIENGGIVYEENEEEEMPCGVHAIVPSWISTFEENAPIGVGLDEIQKMTDFAKLGKLYCLVKKD